MTFLTEILDNHLTRYLSELELNTKLLASFLFGTVLGTFISPYLKGKRKPLKFVKGRLNYKNKPLKDSIYNSSSEGEGVVTDEDEESEVTEVLEPCKMVLIVRNDLKMGKGKAAAQCSHATLGCYKIALRKYQQYLEVWELEGQAKVTLRCDSEEEMLQIQAKAMEADVPNRSILDAGRTQLEPNTRTVLGIGPAPISKINRLTGHLKLY